jgi:hypothetical protein
MWQAVGEPVDPAMFGDFTPDEVLYWHDGPVLFTVGGNRFLSAFCDNSAANRFDRYLVVPISEDELSIVGDVGGEKILTFNGKRILDVMNKPVVYVVDLGYDGNVKGIIASSLSQIPSDCLPDADAVV